MAKTRTTHISYQTTTNAHIYTPPEVYELLPTLLNCVYAKSREMLQCDSLEDLVNDVEELNRKPSDDNERAAVRWLVRIIDRLQKRIQETSNCMGDISFYPVTMAKKRS